MSVRFALAAAFVATALAAAVVPSPAAAGPKALFDNTHAETAGNADWEIDTDQPLPVPDQSTVTEATDRQYWLGAISSWGIDLVKRGYTVATLTSTYGITYGNSGNPYDLAKYDVFIVAEPNTRFSAAESLAIFNFVRDGGGLVAISDHDISDRNNDGFDSPRIWDRLDSQHFFGVHFDTTGEANNNISQNSGNYETSVSDSITHGPNGVADSVSYHNGTTMVLYPAVNPTVTGDLWINGQSHGTTNVMAAHAVYGNGRIGWVGDSSPVDDGSAAPGNSSIFDGWGEAGGRDSLLLQNMTQWVTRRTTSDGVPPTVTVTAPNGGELWLVGTSHTITWTASDNVGVTSVDLAWSTDGGATYPNVIATGLANTGSYSWSPTIATASARVRATAHDAANNSGSDASNANFATAQWTILASASAGGTIAPSGTVTVAHGANQAFTLTPSAGFAVASIVVDGVTLAAASSYTFTNVTANHTIVANFKDTASPTVTVTAPNGGELWLVGTSHSITWNAADNVGVASVDLAWSTDGGATYPNSIATGVPNGGTYSWSPNLPTAAGRVRVTAHDPAGNSASDASDANFATAQWTILASAGPGGAIAPSGTVTVTHGANQSFTLTPNAGYGIASIVVDGVTLAAASSYTFTNVTANHTIEADFVDTALPTVTVTAPNGGELWLVGTSQTITWTASDNVGVTSVDIAWSTDAGATYPNVIATGLANTGSYGWSPTIATASARVRVTAHDAASNSASDASDGNFTTAQWTILASAGPGGAIAPSGAVTVNHDATQSFTLSPDAGYAVASIVVDGATLAAASSYTFTHVTANHTIEANFADVHPVITLDSPSGGEQWLQGETHDISWNSAHVGATVDLDVSFDGPLGPWSAIEHGAPNTGDYAWLVPYAQTDSAYVRVTGLGAGDVPASDSSHAAFSIYPSPAAAPGPRAWMFALARPAPNPSHDGIALRFSLARAGDTRLEIVDLAGRRVRELVHAGLAAGAYTLAWDGRDASGARAPAGLYLVRLVSGRDQRTGRIVRF